MYIFRIGLEGMIHLAKGDLKECEDVGQLFAFYDVCFFYLFHIYIYRDTDTCSLSEKF